MGRYDRKLEYLLSKIFGPKMHNSAQFYFSLYQPMCARMDEYPTNWLFGDFLLQTSTDLIDDRDMIL